MNRLLCETIRAIIDESHTSSAAFFLGNDADRATLVRIRDRGYKILEGRYDTLVYHPSHWRVLTQRQAGPMLEGLNSLPVHGLLEAGVEFPYSHLLIPISCESKVLLQRLFGIPRDGTFGNMLKEAMSRRDFLKKAAKVAAAGAAAGPLGATKAVAGATIPTAITSKGGAALGSWLANDIMYAIVKDTVYKGWKKAKEIAQREDPNLSWAEINRLENFLQDVEVGEENWEILEPQLDALEQILPSFVDRGMLQDKISMGIWEDRYPEYFEQIRKESEGWTRQEREELEDVPKEYGDLPGPEGVKEPWEYEGFEDMPYVDDEEERPWLGEDLRIPVPSLRHLPKAWSGGKDAWSDEIDRILG